MSVSLFKSGDFTCISITWMHNCGHNIPFKDVAFLWDIFFSKDMQFGTRAKKLGSFFFAFEEHAILSSGVLLSWSWDTGSSSPSSFVFVFRLINSLGEGENGRCKNCY